MKIAVSSTGTTMDSQIDPRFGRTSYFLIVDPERTEILDVIDNRASQEVAHGAGINAATLVAQSGASVVLTGRVGPKAYAILRAAGIKVVSEITGSVRDALEVFTSGNMQYSDGPDGDAHASSPSPRDGWMGGTGRGAGRGSGRGCGVGGGGRRGGQGRR